MGAEGEQMREETALHPSGGREQRRTSGHDAGSPVILIADDDTAFRYALRQMIAAGERSFVIEEAEDGLQCLQRRAKNGRM